VRTLPVLLAQVLPVTALYFELSTVA
jgi:hypothetical protein